MAESDGNTDSPPELKSSRTTLVIIVSVVAIMLLFVVIILGNWNGGAGDGDITKEEGTNYGDSRGGNADVLGLTFDRYIGEFFTHPVTGMTLYMKKDGSNCIDVCLRDWEPYLATDTRSEGNISVVRRPDSQELQYAWKEKPLYTFKKDMKPGDVLGDGFDLVWVMARP